MHIRSMHIQIKGDTIGIQKIWTTCVLLVDGFLQTLHRFFLLTELAILHYRTAFETAASA